MILLNKAKKTSCLGRKKTGKDYLRFGGCTQKNIEIEILHKLKKDEQ